LIKVSATGFEGECTRCGESVSPFGFTQYGLAIDIPYDGEFHGRYTTFVTVNEPWQVVSGGCGEACAHPCLSHYLEFQPTPCLSSHAHAFGIATDQEDPPIAEVIVQLIEPRTVETCCPLECSY
jgi:hypothetical protein